jgi:hypothetical protein
MDGQIKSSDASPPLLKPRDTQTERICLNCGLTKPINKFNGKGSTILKNGDKVKYRESICRQCDRERRYASGVCCMCARSTRPGSRYCEKHLQGQRTSMKKRNQQDKLAAFIQYGSECAYCHDKRTLFLTIDHIENNGAEHRRQQRSGQNGGHNIYAWLRKNNYPKGFQTLCYNCNCTKAQIGEKALLFYLSNTPNAL